ncbi:MAG: hypothetical protein VX700_08465 [Pseudomonadota bacterium]|nr:hypothetical protein [Pseudomonadota bacterium]
MAYTDVFRSDYRFGLIALAIGMLTAACVPVSGTTSSSNETSSGETSTSTARTAVGFAQFSDIAVPAGARMDVERSLVLGTRDDWIGRLSMATGQGPSMTYDFFLREMPKFRWQEITTVRSETSVLTYSRENRIATIQISKKTLGGSKIDVTVSPRGRAPSGSSPITAAP